MKSQKAAQRLLDETSTFRAELARLHNISVLAGEPTQAALENLQAAMKVLVVVATEESLT